MEHRPSRRDRRTHHLPSGSVRVRVPAENLIVFAGTQQKVRVPLAPGERQDTPGGERGN